MTLGSFVEIISSILQAGWGCGEGTASESLFPYQRCSRSLRRSGEKLQRSRVQICFVRAAHLHFELLRRSVAKSGMQPLLVVIAINELFDVIAQVFEFPILVGVDFLVLKRLD